MSKRILIIVSEFPPGPGGIGTHAYQLARWLRHFGWHVCVMASQVYSDSKSITAFNAQLPFSIVKFKQLPFPPLKAIYRWMKLNSQIKIFKPDILLASGDRDIYLTGFVARQTGLPWIAVEHGRIPAWWERIIKRYYLGNASGVVCVSQYTQKKMREMRVSPRTSLVIANGADPEVYRILNEPHGVLKKRLNCGKGPFIITVGSVSDRKGQDVVIRALPFILKEFPDTKYVMAGLPAKEKEFSKLAVSLGVKESICFLGAINTSALVEWLNVSDIFVMTSRHTAHEFEGYGIAVVEAALCGKPALVSNNSGVYEAIIEGETGSGVPENNERALAEAIKTLLKNPEKCLSMGKAARERALKEQTWEKRIVEYDHFLNKILKEPLQ